MLKKTITPHYALFALPLFLIGTFALGSTAAENAPVRTTEAVMESLVASSETSSAVDVSELLEGLSTEAPASEDLDSEVLWLARCIYSETKRPDEQELVAWVVRNRVEQQYRGKKTYKDVVLDPYQFSAFNPGSGVRSHYVNLTPRSRVAGWQTALMIAEHVYHADRADRPFSHATMHFYSEQSMVGRRTPAWAVGKNPVEVRDRDLKAERFRFFARIA